MSDMTEKEADEYQQWAEMEGSIAFHLIERHADDWEDVGKMMRAWLRANAKKCVEEQDR